MWNKLDNNHDSTKVFDIRALLNDKKLKNVQEEFSKMHNIYTIVIDDEYQWINDFYGEKKGVAQLKKYISDEEINLVQQLLTNNSLEDRIIADTEFDNIKIAAISIKNNDKPGMMWLICCVLENNSIVNKTGMIAEGFDNTITMEEFNSCIDIISDMSEMVLKLYSRATNKIEQEKLDEYGDEEYNRYKVITKIVRRIEDEPDAKVLSNEILMIIGEYLNISSAYIFAYNEMNEKFQVSASWHNQNIKAIIKKDDEVFFPYSYYKSGPVIISSSSKKTRIEERIMHRAHLKAIMLLPICVDDGKEIYLCLNECTNEREFTIEEIKFANEMVKLTSSIFERKSKEDIVYKYRLAYQRIINDMPGSVLIASAEDMSVVFTDEQCRKDFFAPGGEGEILISQQDLIRFEEEENLEYYLASQERWFDVFFSKIVWTDSRECNLYIFHDITEKKTAKRAVQRQVYNDYLTGLWNRSRFEVDLITALTQAKATRSKGIVLSMDIDEFRNINDELGHRYGDELLRSIATKLKEIEVIKNSCYRLSGDEFSIIIPSSQYSKVRLIAEDVHNIFSTPWEVDGQWYYCTMSIGMVVFPDEGITVDKIIKKCERALKEAKRNGKNQLVEFDGKLEISVEKRNALEKNMKRAVNENIDEFYIEVQPIVKVIDGKYKCIGGEALVRWKSEELGVLQPGEFIATAESTGMINKIGEHVMRQAFRECKYWMDSGRDEFKINVNLSVIQLQNPNIVSMVEGALKETDVNPRNIRLEVTESLLIQDIDKVKEILLGFKKLGVKVALDDFGTGYSSLNYLKELPFDIVKIDKSFLMDIESDMHSLAFLRFLRDLVLDLDATLCVEGVENELQYNLISEMKMQMMQGFYFDRPLGLDKFREKYL